MTAVTYLTNEQDWSRALNDATSLDALRAVVRDWTPYVSDAQEVVDSMGLREFEQWRDGLILERAGTFAGEDFAHAFCALLLPIMLTRCTALAQQCGVPLGAMLLRVHEMGQLAEVSA